MAVNFVKFLRTTLCTTTVDNCLWMLRGVVEKNALKRFPEKVFDVL